MNQSKTESKIDTSIPDKEAAMLIEFECEVGQGEAIASDNDFEKKLLIHERN